MSYEIETKDGIVIRGIPDDVAPDSPDIKQRVEMARASQRQFPVAVGNEGFKKAVSDEYKGKNWADRQLIGAGTALSNVIEGGKQIFGGGDKHTIEANRVIASENPGAALAGNVAMFAPTAMIPGANTYTGAGLAGGVMGALQPTVGGESRALNTAVGVGAGVAGQGVANRVGQAIANRTTQGAADRARNTVRDATLREAQAEGYVVPKSAVNPGFLNNRLESIAGKAALGQEAASRNQGVTNQLARRAIGLPDDAPLSMQTLEAVRHQAAQPYREIAAMSPGAARSLEQLKEARFNATNHFNFFNRSGDPAALQAARGFQHTAEQLESNFERMAQTTNNPNLVQQLREARTLIARTYDVERALNLGSGDVSARSLGRSLDRGRPLTGELATAARFAEGFPAYAREGASIPTPGVSKSEALTSTLLGVGGYGMGGPAGAALAALPLASVPVRSGLLSPAYQRGVIPEYGPGAAMRGLGILGPVMPVAAAGGALESLR